MARLRAPKKCIPQDPGLLDYFLEVLPEALFEGPWPCEPMPVKDAICESILRENALRLSLFDSPYRSPLISLIPSEC